VRVIDDCKLQFTARFAVLQRVLKSKQGA
jgi:hypothetical protein